MAAVTRTARIAALHLDRPEIAAGPARRRRWRFALEVATVFAGALTVLIAASLRFGLTWDEASYFRYADEIRSWWHQGAPIDAAALARYWGYDPYNNFHPPFMRTLAAIGAGWASRWLPFPTSYRCGHLVWIALCTSAAYALLRRSWTMPAAATAMAFALLQPRVFGHLLIASTDSPVALAWLLLALLAWRLDRGAMGWHRRALWCAYFLVIGCAAATKFTGFLAAAPGVGLFLWRRRWRDATLAAAAAGWALAFMVLCSPHLWHQPLAGATAYLLYPLSRVAAPFSTAYFGKLYLGDLPWHYFAVMSAITVPPLVLALLPLAPLARGEARRLLPAVGFGVGFWLLLVHLPGTPRHDAVRQFVSVYPLLGLVAWMGLSAALERLGEAHPRWRRRGLAAAVSLVAATLLAATVARAHPHELSYYSGFIGGVRGAERAGMELSLYFEAIDRGTLAALDRNLRPGQKLFMSPYWPALLRSYSDHGQLHAAFEMLPQRTRVRPDWLLLVRRRYYIDDRLFVALPAVYEVSYDGVSLVKLVRTADVPAGAAPTR